jgi:hypothetical protein
MSKGKSALHSDKSKSHFWISLGDSILAWNTAYDREAPSDGMSQVFWVLGFIITQGAALIIALQNSVQVPVVEKQGFKIQQAGNLQTIAEPSGWIAATAAYLAHGILSLPGLYLSVSVVMLGALVGIIRSKKYLKAGWLRTYNHGTIHAAWWTLASSVFLIVLLSAAALAKTIPGQVIDVKATDANAYSFRIDKSHGIEVLVRVTVVDFPAGATQMRFWAWLSAPLRERFYIANGRAYVGDYFGDPKRDKPADSPFDEEDKESRQFANIKLQDMKKGETYTFVFKIHALTKLKKPLTDSQIQDAIAQLHTDAKAFRFTLADPI